MDFATIIGILVGMGCMLFGIGFDKVGGFVHPASMLITFGGAIGAAIISLPVEQLKRAFTIYKNAYAFSLQSPQELIDRMVEFAEIARRDGILALENVTENITDDYLVKGIQLAVDGTDPDLIENIMTTELDNLEDRHAKGKLIFDLLTKYTPAWGMIGTLIGLINMLGEGMSDPNALTAGMATALITTMYGSIAANFFFGPIGDKLQFRNDQEVLVKQIILKGVMSIQQGDNPRIVQMKLKIFLPPAERGADEEEA